jgi:hypothetical protein
MIGEEEEEQIKEEMKEIDQKVQEINDFNNRNFSIDKEFLLFFQPYFD